MKRGAGEGHYYTETVGSTTYYCWRRFTDGKRYTVKAKSASIRRERVKAKQAAIEAGLGTARRSGDPQLGDYLDNWLETTVKPSKAVKTYRSYEQAVRLYIKPQLGHIRLSKLDSMTIRAGIYALMDRSPNPVGPVTAGSALIVLKKALNDATREAPPLLRINPAAPVQRPKPGPLKKRVLKSAEADQFFEAAMNAGRFGPMLALILATGVRISEALGWTWGDHEEANNGYGGRPTLRVQRTLVWHQAPVDDEGKKVGPAKWSFEEVKKPRSRRTIPLARKAASALEAIQKQQSEDRDNLGEDYIDNGLLLATSLGTPVVERNISRGLEEILKKAKLPHVSLHDLRKTYGTLLADSKTPLHYVQSLLGHESIVTTEKHYLSAQAEGMAKAVEIFD